MVLGHRLCALGHGVLGQFAGQDQADGGLDLARRQRALLVVVHQLARLVRDLVERVVHEGVHDRHRPPSCRYRSENGAEGSVQCPQPVVGGQVERDGQYVTECARPAPRLSRRDVCHATVPTADFVPQIQADGGTMISALREPKTWNNVVGI